MEKTLLDGKWKIRWSDGQRGGSPHYNKEPGQELDADLLGKKKEISDLYDERKWMDATVPGEVHLDLWKQGIIDNPYTGSNVLKARWVEEFVWYYRRVFEASDQYNSKHAFLKFDGLDYGAIVYLNGKEIGRHENAFYPLTINVSGKLKKENNVLVVRLESGIYSVSEKKITHLYSATMGIDNLLHKRMWIRKPQFSTGWDWAPRMMNVGIYKSVSLLTSDYAVITQSQIKNSLSKDLKKGCMRLSMFSETDIPKECNLSVEVSIDGVKIPCESKIENNEVSAIVNIDEPSLWYPIGYGEQKLYSVDYKLYIDNEIIYSGSKVTGFRLVEIDQSTHPDKGNYFILKVNGISIFAKGANFVPSDMIIAAADNKTRYNRLVDLAARANFNFLRVWGGGIYENESFFEICDRKGIMVWHDFISACATLPYSDEQFARSVKSEAVFNVRRLSHYPSLVAWCGNNEVDVHKVKQFQKSKNLPEDTKMYFDDLSKIVSEEDPEKYYQPSSPYSFDGSCYQNEYVGDQHPWSVGFLNKDYRDYLKMNCRFPNEGGILGPVGMSAISGCISDNNMHINSFEWDIHNNMLESWEYGTSADKNIEFWFNKDAGQLSLEEYVYAGGFVQSEGLTTYIDNFRSRKFDSAAAVFWMFNDCWPTTVSWTIVDYYLNPTLSFHSVRRAFECLRVIVLKDGEGFAVVVNSDYMKKCKCILRVGVFNCSGKYIHDESIEIIVPENSRDEYFRFPKDIELTNSDIPFAIVYDDKGNVLSQNRFIGNKYFELPLLPSDISVSTNDGEIILNSDVFVMGVCIDIQGDPVIEDNMFDLFPGISYKIKKTQDYKGIINTVNDFLQSKKQEGEL